MGSSRVLLAGLPFRSWDQARTEPWGELLLIELTGSKATRRVDAATGFELLDV